MSLDLRKVGHFVAVAEELNFTRAAERLHMTQQALSASIRQLERELGVSLLERSTRQVQLTAAGSALLEDGRPLLAASEAARTRARGTGRGELGRLRVGHTPAVTGEEVAELARAVRARRDGISVSAHQLYPDELISGVLAGELEVGLARQLDETPGLAMRAVAWQPLRVAVAAGHRLAGREQVDLREFAEDTVVVWGHPGRSGYTNLLVDVCRRAGFEPRLQRNPIQGTPPITAAAEGGRVAFVTDPPGPSADGRTVVLALRAAPQVALQALWREEPASPLVGGFLAALAARHEAAAPAVRSL